MGGIYLIKDYMQFIDNYFPSLFYILLHQIISYSFILFQLNRHLHLRLRQSQWKNKSSQSG